MLLDSFGREIAYLRISVTECCNFRCVYCVPPDGTPFKKRQDILKYEDIAAIAKEAGKLGFYKIRLTGGEPLIKHDIEKCVAMITATGFYRDICMTTNGSLLTNQKAIALKQAGLHRITISLDTLDSVRFTEITQGGQIDSVLAGIEATVATGFENTKINMVISETTLQSEIDDMKEFCKKKGMKLQLISKFSLANRKDISVTDVVADRPPKCEQCNRIRITADGHVKSCLFSDNEIKIDLNDIQKSIINAVKNKPNYGIACHDRHMHQIGG